ncbi:MAG: hypothetical protein RLY18_984 [Pseudomonadota bacterium]
MDIYLSNHEEHTLMRRFDHNGDGKLTLEEAKAGMPRVAANFQRIDTQKKGYVTAAEIKAMADR